MANVEIKTYEDKDALLWDQFVDQSINGTIFHKRKFLGYHPKSRFADDSLMFFHRGQLAAVFPAAAVKVNGRNIIKSHPGASYGGLVIKDTFGLNVLFNIFEELETHAKTHHYTTIEFRMSEKIFNVEPCDQIDFTLISKNYTRQEEEISTCYFLPQYKDLEVGDILKRFSQKTRNETIVGIKSGLTFSVIEDDASLERFYNILAANLKKHAAKPVHTLEEIKLLNTSFDNDVKVFSINYKDKIIGGFLVFKINQKGLHIFYSVLDYQYQNLRPINFGMLHLIQYGINEGFKYLNYGISTEEGGRKVNWGLLKFKEGFNGSGALRTYWKKTL